MPGQEVTVIGTQAIEAPKQTVARARDAASELKAVIAQKPKPVVINGEQFLEYEDWQLLGQFYGVATQTNEAVAVEINGVRGAKASAQLYDIHTGCILGGVAAEAYCMEDEERWGDRPWHQLASMAQTRAGAKALRNRFAWVVVLAGYKATPAEEITDSEHGNHWCAVHNVRFFKKGKMPNYAHTIGDTGQWCNEPSENRKSPTVAVKPPAESQTTSAEPEPTHAKDATKDGQPSTSQPPSTVSGNMASKPKRDPASIKDKTTFQQVCHADFNLNSAREITGELNISSMADIADWGEAYQTIAAARQ